MPNATTEQENDIDQYLQICKLCGTPTAETWSAMVGLPGVQLFTFKERYPRRLQAYFKHCFRHPLQSAIDFVDQLLMCDPARRPDANVALDHDFLWGDPAPCEPET